MTHVAEELFDDAMKLSDRERRVLALWLLDTVGDEPLEEVEEAWAKEATRRLMICAQAESCLSRGRTLAFAFSLESKVCRPFVSSFYPKPNWMLGKHLSGIATETRMLLTGSKTSS